MAVLLLWVNKQNKMLWGKDVQKGWQNGPFGVSCPWTSSKRDHLGWRTVCHHEWGSSYWNICSTMWQLCKGGSKKDTRRHPHMQQTDMAKEMAPEHPTVRTHLGSTNQEIFGVTEWVQEYVLAPSELPCQQQEEYMTELHQDLNQHMVGAGFQSTSLPARPTSQSRKCSCRCSSSWTQSLLDRPRGVDAAKQLREESSWGNPDPGVDILTLGIGATLHRSELWWHQNPPPPQPHSGLPPTDPVGTPYHLQALHAHTPQTSG